MDDNKTRVWEAKLNPEHYEHNKEAMNHLRQLSPLTHEVTGCKDCLFCYDSYSCEHPSNYDERGQIHEDDISLFAAKENRSPKFCPLDKEPITIAKKK